MWIADNSTPFAIERGFLRDVAGREVLIVVARGTFSPRPDGTLRRADEQRPVRKIPAYAGDPLATDLLEESDLVLSKGGTDVIVHGHAYAPHGRATVADVALRVGERSKHLRVFGPRVWTRALASSAVVPGPALAFDRMPVTWGRAWGGVDPTGAPEWCAANPLGSGFALQPQALLDQAAPNVEWPNQPLSAGRSTASPAGFGAIAPHWEPRIGFAGTYDAAWTATRAPLLPKNFDQRFYRCVPVDQQFPFLAPGARVELVNMTSDGVMRAIVPNIRIRFRAMFRDGEAACDGALHTVILDADDRRVQLVWHGAIPCHQREHLIERAVVEWDGDTRSLFT